MKYFLLITTILFLGCSNAQNNVKANDAKETLQDTFKKSPVNNVLVLKCSFDFNKLKDSTFITKNIKSISKLDEQCIFEILDTLGKSAIKFRDFKSLYSMELILSNARKRGLHEVGTDQMSEQFYRNFENLSLFFLSNKNTFLEKTITTNFAYDLINAEKPENGISIEKELEDEKSYREDKRVRKKWNDILAKAKIEKSKYD